MKRSTKIKDRESSPESTKTHISHPPLINNCQSPMRVCSATTTASAVCNKLIIIFLSELNLFYSSFTFSVSIPLQVVFRLRRIFRQKQFLPLGLFRRTPGLLLAAGLTLFSDVSCW